MEVHRPLTQQACYSTKKIWTRQCIHRESIPPSKACLSHSKFDPTASHDHKITTMLEMLQGDKRNKLQLESLSQNSKIRDTSWNIQSRMEYDWAERELPLVLAPLGKAEGNRCNREPFRSLLTVVPLEETTKHRLPAGLANTYLHNKDEFRTFR